MRESMTHRKRAKGANAQHWQQQAMLFGRDSVIAQAMHTQLSISNAFYGYGKRGDERGDDDADPHFGRDRLLGGDEDDIVVFACACVVYLYFLQKDMCTSSPDSSKTKVSDLSHVT